MAKRKLSTEQRASLRADLKKGRADKVKVSDLLRTVAEKYGITTITARWYLNSLEGKRIARKGVKRGAAKRGPGRPAGSRNGSHSDLEELVNEQVRNARAARRLVPRWKKLVSREQDLKKLASKLERQLLNTSKKANAVRRRIDALVGG